jgi:hypothetical protein
MIIRRLSGLAMLVGFALLLGAAGSADLMTVQTIVIRSLIGIAIFLGGFVGLKVSGSDFVS